MNSPSRFVVALLDADAIRRSCSLLDWCRVSIPHGRVVPPVICVLAVATLKFTETGGMA